MNVDVEVERILATGLTVVFVTFAKAVTVPQFEQFVATFAKQGVTVFAQEAQWNAVAGGDTAFLCSSFTVIRDPTLNQRYDATAEEDVAAQTKVRDFVKELRDKPATPAWPTYCAAGRYVAYKSCESIRETAAKIGALPDEDFLLWAVKPYGACAAMLC